LAVEFGFAVVGSLVGGVFAGRYLDQRLHTSPVFLLVGLIAGFVFSIYLIYVIYRLQVAPASSASSAAPGPARTGATSTDHRSSKGS
jgi:F0F1-type ATP synthase assembly protein I